MKELTNSETALLGLLSEQPMYPYQIEQEVKYRDMRSWTELSMSSIYKLLKKLETKGLVLRTNEISEENRLRKLYTISETGKEQLGQKLESLLTAHDTPKWQVDIATYNCDLLDGQTVKTALTHYRKELVGKIQGYKDLLQFLKDAGCPPHRFAVAKRPVYLFEAEINWLDDYIAELSETTFKEDK